ncbi:DUF58 domain-containing protein [Evansella sp. AB-P1]|uniref:DUF58 domain-containing protein n=1 Tax=Evansella sp. AB-P1 TaxID=3037653 RepID=UPI00241FB8EB|nr:DUF58 domain-containing protein [Evansella sp. AB-P1]MDG5789563.1 DUF58 domain-containing protein [Evansella sp. AB-P1]
MTLQWLIFLTVVIIFLQRVLYEKRALKHIYYNRYFNKDAIFEGEELKMIEEIVNRKLLPVPWLRLESKFSEHLQFQTKSTLDIAHDQFHRSLFSLLPFQKIKRHYYLKGEKRGHYWQKHVSMTSGDPFGLVNKKETINISAEVFVYPKLLSLDEIPLPSRSWQGDITVRRWIMEDPFIIAGVREYSYGDPMKTINWKATARTNTLQVSKNDYTADHHLMIYLNFDLTEDIWMPIQNEGLIETGISYAASIAQNAIEQGISTGFGCNSYIIEPGAKVERIKKSVRVEPNYGSDHLHYLFQTMSKLKMDRSKSFNRFLEEDVTSKRRDTDILFITSMMTRKMEEHIWELEKEGNAVEILWLQDSKNIDVGIEQGEKNVQ